MLAAPVVLWEHSKYGIEPDEIEVICLTMKRESKNSFRKSQKSPLGIPKEFAPASGFSYRQYPSEHEGR